MHVCKVGNNRNCRAAQRATQNSAKLLRMRNENSIQTKGNFLECPNQSRWFPVLNQFKGPWAPDSVQKMSLLIILISLVGLSSIACGNPRCYDPRAFCYSYDGRGNNHDHPSWGAAGTPLRREFYPAYLDHEHVRPS